MKKYTKNNKIISIFVLYKYKRNSYGGWDDEKRGIVKLIATLIAMTMIVGNGITVFADAPTNCNQAKDDVQANYDVVLAAPIYDPATQDIASLSQGEYYKKANLDNVKNKYNSFMSYMNASGHGHTDGEGCSTEITSNTQSEFDAFMYACEIFFNEKIVVSGGSCGTTESSTPAPTAEQIAEEAYKTVEAAIAKEESLPVATFASAEAVNAIPAEVKTTTNEATFNISSVTTTQGFVAAVDKVAKASNASSAVSVYSSKPIAMNASALTAVSNTGRDFVYTFTYKGHIYKITIPAGAKVNTNGQLFMGPLSIGAQLGTTEVIK